MAKLDTTKRKRRTYSKALKAKLVEQAITGEHTIASLAQGHGINPKLLQKWISAARDEKIASTLSQTIAKPNSDTNHKLTEQEPAFLPITLQPEPTHEQSATIAVCTSTITGVQLTIPSHHRLPININIDQIDSHSLIKLLRGLQ